MKTLLLPLTLLPALAAAACTDATAPSARVVSVTPDQLVPSDDARDDLVITVAYEDGDGDLGGGTAEVHDCRAEELRTELAIPAIAPDAVIGAPIRGTLELHVSDVGAAEAAVPPDLCRALGAPDARASAAVFCVVLVDAAGHRGDGDCTQEVALMAE